jgi:hypothetical protein
MARQTAANLLRGVNNSGFDIPSVHNFIDIVTILDLAMDDPRN